MNMIDTGGTPAKFTGYYRCPDNIDLLKIRIRLRLTGGENSEDKEDEWHTQEFSWQEKHFSRTQREFYRDIHNCITDLDKIYHERVENSEDADAIEQQLMFTYTDQDKYISQQEVFSNKVLYLQKHVESKPIENSSLSEESTNQSQHYDHKASILSSITDAVLPHDVEKMYILCDMGEYVNDLWIKDEQVLCIIKYDKTLKVLSVWPNFSSTQPYTLNLHGDINRSSIYFVENCSQSSLEDEQKVDEIINKISDCKKYLKDSIVGDKFHLPPKNKLYVYLSIEIMSGKNFHQSDLYLRYYIDLPDRWSCQDANALKGITQKCHGTNSEGLMHFGHNLDVVLEYDLVDCEENELPKTPYIYFEVISKTIWNCYRREGVAYKNLPISLPGCHSYKLGCYKFDRGFMQRFRTFFVGDCDDMDIKWIGLPQDHNDLVLNKFGTRTVGNGELNIRVNIIHQSQAFMKEFVEGSSYCERIVYDKLKASSLIRSVNQVLLDFKRARKNLIEVRQNL